LRRTVLFVSDRTGITAETLAHSLLSQFEQVDFNKINLPFVDSLDKAKAAAERINEIAIADGERPLVFSTMVDDTLRQVIESSSGFVLDMFQVFVKPLETELGTDSSHAVGRSHGVVSDTTYQARIEAINFALANDDGVTNNYDKADVVLIGVSRTGKTPTSLYMALQFGVLAANYPLIEQDMGNDHLPGTLTAHREKLFGLSILPDRLRQIRSERRPNSDYASLRQCEREVRHVESIFRREGIPFINTSAMSIEEIATTIMEQKGIERRWYG
jgi:regulator of PEP synthase PpsR (kinase-PPPase family)